ncbi:hypothetical protein COU38_01895 [Candidatus Micrarchaeota archaeon CG10_big_fil_rev_8_21_14_0_10_54_18]|nr:MAG: hypothetical protein COT57_02605 [Candidatus Micrarchaeota archaeon CG09_land_8_20_14_0_10_55_25]PJD01255.1 MAG: hypothetical protein COU38_01895 [Candidatus Micrarchaeota archaeon CG10_big_fil_rev_8_21_14_0_10_54_18]
MGCNEPGSRGVVVEVIEKGVPPEGWNSRLGKHATIYHTREYAEYLEKEGFNVWHSKNGKFLLWSKKVLFGLITSFSSVYVPPLDASEARELAQFLKGKNAVISVHPLAADNGELGKAGFKKKEWATFLLDLRRGKEELWAGVDKATRKIVRRTREKGVEVRTAENEEDYAAYHAVMNENRRRNKVKEYPYSRAFWELFKEAGMGEIFVAELDGRILGGLTASLYNDYVNEWGAALSNKAREEKIYASDAVRWAVIEWARAKGAHYYDLTGVNPAPRDEKEKGIYRFKEKWGGDFKEYCEYSTSNAVVDFARKIKHGKLLE